MSITLRFLAVASIAVLLGGCCCLDDCLHRVRLRDRNRPAPAPPTFSQYHLEGWDWSGVSRVVLLPFRNESEYTRAGEESRAALAAELQRAGRFEVISAAPDDQAVRAAEIRCGGRFDELAMLEIGHAMKADVVIHGIVSQYSPYPRPRLGLVLQAVSPQEAKVVASVDGLWDTTDLAIAERVRVYYRQRARERPPWIRNHVIASDDSFAAELALDSPLLFRRFVARECVLALLGLPVPGVVMGAETGANCAPQPTIGKHSK